MIDLAMTILTIRKEQDGGHAQVSIKDNDVNLITWHDGNPTNITNDQILARNAELSAANVHVDPRMIAYPKTVDQLDMMWHDKKDGTTTWEDAIQAIKDAHPKP